MKILGQAPLYLFKYEQAHMCIHASTLWEKKYLKNVRTEMEKKSLLSPLKKKQKSRLTLLTF